MKIKRFVDKDMRSVLKRVRSDQGAEAVILSNRRIDDGIEVIAAVDYDEALMQHALRSKFGSSDRQDLRKNRQNDPDTVTADDISSDRAARLAENPAVSEAIQTVTDLVEPETTTLGLSATEPLLELELEDSAEIKITRSGLQGVPSAVAEKPPTDDSSLAKVQAEIFNLRDLLESQVSGLLWADGNRRTPELSKILRAFARMGVAPDVCDTIVKQLGPPRDWNKVGPKAMQALGDLLPVKKDSLLTKGGIVALIGPTGVGKTTTIAKLAARFAIANGNEDVALVCADAYRIGAREHLTALANILGVDIFTADGPDDLQLLLAQLTEKKLVLIDTEGLSQRDVDLTERLESWRHNCDTVEFYLTLSARSQEIALDEAVSSFKTLPLAGAIVTKVDEAGQLGCAISTLIRHQLPLAWITNGQNIPEDLRPADGQQSWLLSHAVDRAKENHPQIDEFMMAENYGSVGVQYA